MAYQLSDAQLDQFMDDMRKVNEKSVAGLPAHTDYIKRHCAAG